jgi:geranylgeranyl pyrophosphate synthase
MILALERCNKGQKKWLRECLRSKPLSDDDVQSVIDLYQDLDVIDSARSKMEELYDSAEQSLEIFGESEDKRDLIQLIRTLKKRDH